jgi:hypothetical protein
MSDIINGLAPKTECDSEVATDGTATVKSVVSLVNAAISANWTVLALSGLLLGVALMVIWYAVHALYTAIRDWMNIRARRSGGKASGGGSSTSSSGGVSAAERAEMQDDVVYSGAATAAGERRPPRAELAAVNQRVSDIQALYAPYNSAMVRYAQRHGRKADDLMDQHIISRTDDNYTYRRRRRDDLRFR